MLFVYLPVLTFHLHYLEYMTSLSDATSGKIQSDIASGLKSVATLAKKNFELSEEAAPFEDYIIDKLLQICRKVFTISKSTHVSHV